MEINNEYVKDYIDCFLENDDEITEKYERQFREIQENEEKIKQVVKEINSLYLKDYREINENTLLILKKIQ